MVYKDFDEILCHECVLGFEQDYYVATSFMACQKGFILILNTSYLYTPEPFLVFLCFQTSNNELF